MRKFSKEAVTSIAKVLTKLQCDGSSSNGYVRSTACGGGADFQALLKRF